MKARCRLNTEACRRQESNFVGPHGNFDTRAERRRTDHVAALQSQDQALAAEQSRTQGEVDAAHRALAEAQTATAGAQKEFQALQAQINTAAAELNAIQAQIRAAKPELNSTGANPNP